VPIDLQTVSLYLDHAVIAQEGAAVPEPKVLEAFVALVEANRHAEAIEQFYSEDASMQENLDPPRKGRAVLVAGERAFLTRWKEVRSTCVRPAFAAGNHVVIRWNFEFVGQDGSRLSMDELAYQRWHGDKIVEERFYYDPKQLRG
jgi:hypothetical protein